MMRKSVLALCIGISLASFPLQASAQQVDITAELGEIVRKSANELAVQINLAGKQRMLTQKMTKEALLVALDLDAANNADELKKTVALFEKTLKGLERGDDELKLVKAPNETISAQLDVVMKLWEGFKPLVLSVTAGKTDPKVLGEIAARNLELLAEMDKAVKMFEQAAGTDMEDLAVAVNLSGRQRMLTQKMAKEYFLVALNIDKENNRKALADTVALFDTTLKGLLNGDEKQALPPATDPDIRTQLKKVMGMWSGYKALLEQPVSRENLEKVAQANMPIMREMNKVVELYEVSW